MLADVALYRVPASARRPGGQAMQHLAPPVILNIRINIRLQCSSRLSISPASPALGLPM